jgi:hypothetical protein
MDRPYRRVSVLLPGNEFDTLQALAEREERTPREQATYLVRRSLATKNAGDPAGGRDDRGPEAA